MGSPGSHCGKACSVPARLFGYHDEKEELVAVADQGYSESHVMNKFEIQVCIFFWHCCNPREEMSPVFLWEVLFLALLASGAMAAVVPGDGGALGCAGTTGA